MSRILKSDELKPCPFCGNKVVWVFQDDCKPPIFDANCDDCGATGAPTDTKKQAILAWNMRRRKMR